ncbi:MAG: cytochrome C oxidase subunit IV family protein [Thermoguttaceae bacterium]|jgi:cytochrome c oxidase subunit 4
MASYSGVEPAAADSSHLGHVVPLGVLAAVWGALVALTVLTVAAAGVDLGNLNLYIALAIAGVKAALVVLYFMHLRYDRPFLLVVFLGCLAFVVLFISLAMTDARAYAPSLVPGQAPSMKDVHTPFGTGD